MKFGKQLDYLSPSHQVRDQNEPTEANPISQHKQFKGHETAMSHIKKEPK